MFNISKEQVLAAMKYRRATRAYDPNKKISADDFNYILEMARLSPSSVGSEPWQFLVIQNPAIRQQLKAVGWGMVTQLDDASHLVVILAKKNARYDSAYLYSLLEKRNLTQPQIEQALARYKSFQLEDTRIAENEHSLFDWTSKQTYIALANMMTGAALIGIDSCPIEGFDYAKVNQILADHQLFDPQEWGVSVIATFGYRAKDIAPKSRKSMDEIVHWVE